MFVTVCPWMSELCLSDQPNPQVNTEATPEGAQGGETFSMVSPAKAGRVSLLSFVSNP